MIETLRVDPHLHMTTINVMGHGMAWGTRGHAGVTCECGNDLAADARPTDASQGTLDPQRAEQAQTTGGGESTAWRGGWRWCGKLPAGGLLT